MNDPQYNVWILCKQFMYMYVQENKVSNSEWPLCVNIHTPQLYADVAGQRKEH